MNINLKSAFFAALFFAPISIYSEQTVRIVSKDDCKKLVEKFIKELEQESKATRPDGKPTILSKKLKIVLSRLKQDEKFKQDWIDELFKIYSNNQTMNIELEDERFFIAFCQACIAKIIN